MLDQNIRSPRQAAFIHRSIGVGTRYRYTRHFVHKYTRISITREIRDEGRRPACSYSYSSYIRGGAVFRLSRSKLAALNSNVLFGAPKTRLVSRRIPRLRNENRVSRSYFVPLHKYDVPITYVLVYTSIIVVAAHITSRLQWASYCLI